MQIEKIALGANIYLQAAQTQKLKAENDSLIHVVLKQDRSNEPDRKCFKGHISMRASICNMSVWLMRFKTFMYF